MSKIPVIDLFAGPGGLGEGFSSFTNANDERIFKIKLSIEKDEHAHETLRLRSFYRQFEKEEVPKLYYQYIKENSVKKQKVILEKIKSEYAEKWRAAEKEAWHFEMPYMIEEKERLRYDTSGNPYYEKYSIGFSKYAIRQKHKEIDSRIIEALSGRKDFVMIGGPPCQAYSVVGRARNQGISKEDHRVHLYKEYLRIIAKHHPAIFVMENVKGLLSAEIEGEKVFNLILKDLTKPSRVYKGYKSPKYKIYSFVKKASKHENGFPVYENDYDFLIKTEKYGIPQRRHRVILLGVREDISVPENFNINRVERETTLKQVIGSLPRIRSGIGREIIGSNSKGNHIYQKVENNFENWKTTIYQYLNKLDEDIRKEFNGVVESKDQGTNFINCELNEKKNPLYTAWFKDPNLKGVINHKSRTHLKEDLGRYLFSSLYRKAKGDFPRLKDYPDWLLPEHKNAKAGLKFTDRFRTQKPNQAATTITSHISKDGHYFIHYDPSQCRSLTVREAARIQTFPDNYYFCGSRTHQYHQVGNAVPPFLAYNIAHIVYNIVSEISFIPNF